MAHDRALVEEEVPWLHLRQRDRRAGGELRVGVARNRDPVRAIGGPGEPRAVVAPRREPAPQVVQPEELLRGANDVGARARQGASCGGGHCAGGYLRAEADLGAVRELGALDRHDERGIGRRAELPGAHPARIAARVERARLVRNGDVRPRTLALDDAHALAVEHLRRHVPDERDPLRVGDLRCRPDVRVERQVAGVRRFPDIRDRDAHRGGLRRSL